MARSVLLRLSENGLWEQGFQFGDWLDPTAPPDQPWAAKADPSVVATACLHRSAVFVAEAARLIGRPAEEVERRLATLVREAGHLIATGFAGSPFVADALTVTGHVDDAYHLLLQTQCPSWLYPVTMRATTIWERYDSMLPDGSINPGEMTSFNHYAFGAVADWLYRVVAGIAPAAPGYARLRLAPTPGPGLEWARASLETRHGLVESGWRREADGRISVDVLVPDGVEAEVVLPSGEVVPVRGGRHSCTAPAL